MSADGGDNSMPVVSNNFDLDNALIGETAGTGCVICVDDWFEGSPLDTGTRIYPIFTKPAGGFQYYEGKFSVPAGVSINEQLTIYKGYSSNFSSSLEYKDSISAGIFGCDASMEITTGFSYGATIETSAEVSWQVAVDGGDDGRDYWQYQVMILYATQVEDQPDVRSYLGRQAIQYTSKDGYLYYFVPVYRDAPSISSKPIRPISQSDMISYLLGDGFNEWWSPVEILAQGHLIHLGLSNGAPHHVPIVVENGETADHTDLILFSGQPSEQNTYVLTGDGYLIHNGSGKPVVAENGSTADHTRLILFGGTPSTFNTYWMDASGHLYHRGSGKAVVAENGSSDDHTKLILFAGQPSDFNTYQFDGQ